MPKHTESDDQFIDSQSSKRRKLESQDPRYLASLGYILYKRGELERALTYYNQAIALNSTDISTLTVRGEIYTRLGDYENALIDLNIVLARNARSTDALTARAKIYKLQNQIAFALLDINKALKLDQYHAPALKLRCEIYIAQRNYRQAMIDINDAFVKSPRDFSAFHRRADIHMLNNNPTEALEDLRLCFEIRPNYFPALALRQKIYFDLRQYETALEDINKMIAIKPEDIALHYQRARIYAKLKNYNAALLELDICLEMDNYFLDALKARIAIHRELGDIEKAIEDASRFVVFKPDDETMRALRDSLYHQLSENMGVVANDNHDDFGLSDALLSDEGYLIPISVSPQDQITELDSERATSVSPPNHSVCLVSLFSTADTKTSLVRRGEEKAPDEAKDASSRATTLRLNNE